MRQRFLKTAAALLDERLDVVVVLAEISAAQLEELGAAAAHPERLVNVGIREQLMIGVAAGMALEGFRPIVHTYAPFLVERPFEQVKLDFAHQNLGAVLVSVGGSRDAAAAGRTHQAPEDVELISSLPGWTVFVPGHPDEVESILRLSVRMREPVYIRLTETSNHEPVATEPRDGDSGWTRVLDGAPDAATIVAVGPMLDPVCDAVDRLDAPRRPSILYTNRPFPVDESAVRSTSGDELILVAPYLEGTGIAAIARALSDRPKRYLSLGFPRIEDRHYGSRDEHFAAAGLDAAGIAASLHAFLGT